MHNFKWAIQKCSIWLFIPDSSIWNYNQILKKMELTLNNCFNAKAMNGDLWRAPMVAEATAVNGDGGGPRLSDGGSVVDSIGIFEKWRWK